MKSTTFFYIPKFWTFTFSVTQPQVVLNRANTKFSEHIRKLSSFTWDRPPKLSSLVVRSLECRNIVSFLSLQGLPEVPTIEFFPADVYIHRKLDIPFYSRNKNVLSSSRLIYYGSHSLIQVFSPSRHFYYALWSDRKSDENAFWVECFSEGPKVSLGQSPAAELPTSSGDLV